VLGRVATLVAAPGETCGGVAYRLADEHAEGILAELDVREQGGYERLDLPATLRGATLAEGGDVHAVTWVGWPDNPFHLGPAPFEEMVARVREAHGPSGSNAEYVLALDDALRGLEWHDPHVAQLAAALRGA
jgi:glutathione-specific gamma-glutamylcyclotransferase